MTDSRIDIPHPLTDAADDGWIATEQHGEVVGLTPAMSDFLHRATMAGQRALVVTGRYSRMTQPLREALSGVGGHWIVRTGAQEFYDARTGWRLDTPAAILGLDAGEVAPEFLHGALTHRVSLALTFATRHRVTREVQLGGVAESAALAVRAASPLAWGATEPALAPWSRPQLTEYARRRMPDSSRWLVVGEDSARMVGTIAVDRTSEGVEETTHLWVDRGEFGDARHDRIADDALAALTAAAGHGMPLIGLAFAAVSSPDLAVRPLVTAPPQPLALLVGPPGVRQLGVDVKAFAAELGATIVGRPRLPGVLVPLGSLAGGGWERIDAVLGGLGADAAIAALGLSAGGGARG